MDYEKLSDAQLWSEYNTWKGVNQHIEMGCYKELKKRNIFYSEEVSVEQDVEVKQGSQVDLSSMNKDELETYAKEKYGVDLDKRKSKKKLIEQIESLE